MAIKITFGANEAPENTENIEAAEATVTPVEPQVTETQPAQQEKPENTYFGNGFSSAFIDGLIFNNLSLIDFVGLTPIIAGGSTVFNGFVLSAATIILLLIITPFAATVGTRIPEKFAPAVYTILSAAIVAIMAMAGYAIFPNVMMALGFVFPLVAVNGITLNRVRNFAGRNMSATIGDALGKGLGFALVMFVVSALREVLGYGTFCNLSVPFFAEHSISVIAGVPGGFFFMALLAWVIKLISVKTAKAKEKRKEMSR